MLWKNSGWRVWRTLWDSGVDSYKLLRIAMIAKFQLLKKTERETQGA
jgi:hypothetical protein